MAHFVYEIPAGAAPNRRIGEFATYDEASEFAKAQRQKQSFNDGNMVSVIHAKDTEMADAGARRLHEQFDEARRSRPPPSGRVVQFTRAYAEAEDDDESGALPASADLGDVGTSAASRR
jgi:hypothetical protein